MSAEAVSARALLVKRSKKGESERKGKDGGHKDASEMHPVRLSHPIPGMETTRDRSANSETV